MEAFVYCWTDCKTNKLYVGWHKGTEDDGYISSSKYFLEHYNTRPEDFSRTIIASGTSKDMCNFEHTILNSLNAARDQQFYNKHNAGKGWCNTGHSEETKLKIRQHIHTVESCLKKSETWKRKGVYNCDPLKAKQAWIGSKHTEETKLAMKEAAKKHSEARSLKMSFNNPMKNPETIKKMLATRKANKEKKHVDTN